MDQSQDLASEFGITALPTVTAFKNGEKKREFYGAKNESFIQNFIKENL